jgi:Domain of unknown function (DUF4129)
MSLGPPSAWRGDRSAVGWGTLSMAGLALGLVALGSARTAALDGAPGFRLALRVPDALLVTVFGLLSLAAVLLLLFIFQGGRRWRRRKGDEDEFQLYYESPKVSPWAVALMLALALLPVALLVYTLRVGRVPSLEWGGLGARPPTEVSGTAPALGAPPTSFPSERPVVAAPAFGRTLGLVLLLAGVASLGLMVWLWLGDRLTWWWGRPGAESPPAVPLIEAIQDSLEDLQREVDARRAVILCYRRFERWLGDSGVPRAPWETPMEFLRRALGRLPIPSEATAALTRLFELSRFSHHALGAAERDTAVGALMAIRVALENLKVDASAA